MAAALVVATGLGGLVASRSHIMDIRAALTEKKAIEGRVLRRPMWGVLRGVVTVLVAITSAASSTAPGWCRVNVEIRSRAATLLEGMVSHRPKPLRALLAAAAVVLGILATVPTLGAFTSQWVNITARVTQPPTVSKTVLPDPPIT